MWRSCCWATRCGASKYHTEPDRVINSKDDAPRNLLLRLSTQLSTQLTKIAESHQDAKRITERTDWARERLEKEFQLEWCVAKGNGKGKVPDARY